MSDFLPAKWFIEVVTPPDQEPLSLAEVKLFLRVTAQHEDADIQDAISGARARFEELTNRRLITQTLRLNLDAWPCNETVRFPVGPVQSISTVKYVDSSGVLQTIDAANYVLHNDHPPRLVPSYGLHWPTPRNEPAAVRIEFVAGYGTPGVVVPADIRQTLKQIVAYQYQTKGDADHEFVDSLIRRHWSGIM